uniref:Cytochrome P450 n=1 Tax=Aegilops tauschii subsp. strangulata TaxID=200361 RepID=A0A453S9Z0_AEGTS
QKEEGMGAPENWWSTWRGLAVAVTAACLLLHVAARVTDALWWRPRRLEAHFARQGVRGPPYRFLVGCVREMVALMAEATAKPMSPATSHNALPRVLAFYHYWRKIYGPTFLIWFGPTPRLTVADPELVREIFLTRAEAFDRYEAHPIVRQLEGDGLVSLHGDKWALHRRVLAPAFYPDNLNVLMKRIPPFLFGPLGLVSVQRVTRQRRRGGGGRGGVVPGGGRGGHHARHVRAQLRLRPRGVPHAGPPHGLRLRGLPQGARPGLPVLADQEEPDVVGPGQGDQAGPSPAHRPAQRRRRGPRGGDQGEGQQRRLQGPAGADDKCPRQEVAGHAGGGHGGGVQDVLLRRQADDHQPADLGHGAPRHAPGVAGPRPAGGPRRVRPRRAPRQGAPAQAENAGDDPERDAEAVPTGRGHHPQGQGGRHPRRPGDPARHGAADPDHGDPPRRQVLGARRGAVQPRPVRRRRGPGGDAPAGVHPVRARVPDVRRPEPRPARGQAHRGRPAPALRAEAVAQVRARADGADAAPPAVRRARDLPPPVVAPAVRVGP